MAFHHMGASLSEVAEDPSYDVLDACAYQILAALFSIVEPELHASLTGYLRRFAAQKGRAAQLLRFFDSVQENAWAFSEDVVKGVLRIFVFIPERALNDANDRVFRNSQFYTLWQNAFSGSRDNFVEAITSAAATIAMGNHPGDQCIAVVRSRQQLYVTANGLWESGEKLGQTVDPVAYDGDVPKMLARPWFASARQFNDALQTVAPDILGEYNARSIVFVNPMAGDVGGKYHAEMQMMEYMFDHDLLTDRGYIGVSKPCCTFCRLRLDPAGLRYWNGHAVRGEDPMGRVDPFYTTFDTAERLGAFRRAVERVPFYGLVIPS